MGKAIDYKLIDKTKILDLKIVIENIKDQSEKIGTKLKIYFNNIEVSKNKRGREIPLLRDEPPVRKFIKDLENFQAEARELVGFRNKIKSVIKTLNEALVEKS
jgi:hypothetical protein